MTRFGWLGIAMMVAVGAALGAARMHGGQTHGDQIHADQVHGEQEPAGPLHGEQEPAGQMLAESVEIPLRVHEGRLTVPVETEDGTTLEFIVSTANMVTVFSETGKDRVGDSKISVAGLPVSTKGSQTVADSDLTDGGTVFDGIIGSSFLNQFDVLIDAPGGRLVLKTPGRWVEWDGLTLSDPIRVHLLHGAILTLDVELNGQTYPAMLDIGTSSLVVNERVKTEALLENDRSGTLKVGTTTHEDLPVRVLDLPLFHRFSPNGDGFVLVGAPLAYDCAVSISYVRQELRTCVR